jgi:hypothetical protein
VIAIRCEADSPERLAAIRADIEGTLRRIGDELRR